MSSNSHSQKETDTRGWNSDVQTTARCWRVLEEEEKSISVVITVNSNMEVTCDEGWVKYFTKEEGSD